MTELLPMKATFAESEAVEVEARGLSASAALSLWRLEQKLDEVVVDPDSPVASFGALPPGGYGVEADGGYMNLDGRGTPRIDRVLFASDTHGETDSDFYTTIRGRLGFAFGHWLFYATGGGIGVNYETRVIDNCDVAPCGDELINAGKTEFNWGWTGGGGVEYMFGCHWTAKAEYLRYQLDDQTFSGAARFSDGDFAGRFRFKGIGTEGNIVRAGLNYKF